MLCWNRKNNGKIISNGKKAEEKLEKISHQVIECTNAFRFTSKCLHQFFVVHFYAIHCVCVFRFHLISFYFCAFVHESMHEKNNSAAVCTTLIDHTNQQMTSECLQIVSDMNNAQLLLESCNAQLPLFTVAGRTRKHINSDDWLKYFTYNIL